MKKTYVCPAIAQEEVQLIQMLAESLSINDDPVDGKNALSREDQAWDILEQGVNTFQP